LLAHISYYLLYIHSYCLLRCKGTTFLHKTPTKEVAMARFCKNNRTFALTQPYMKHAGRATITL
jgi:hypothetical protein